MQYIGECYDPTRSKAEMLVTNTETLIIPDVTKPISNIVL